MSSLTPFHVSLFAVFSISPLAAEPIFPDLLEVSPTPSRISESHNPSILLSLSASATVDVWSPDIVIVGTRYEVRRDRLPQRMDVITKERSQGTPADDFGDLLKKNSSVDIIQYPGALAGIGLRGFAPNPYSNAYTNTVLVLIDGHPAGTANLAVLDPRNLDHIELLKGPASALYGSEAMAGVLNVVTARSRGRMKGNIFAGAGSSDTWEAGGSAGGKLLGPLDFDLCWSTRERMRDVGLAGGRVLADSTFLVNQGGLRLGTDFPQGWRLDLFCQFYFGRLALTDSDQISYESVSAYKDLDRIAGYLTVEGRLWGTVPTLTLFASQEAYVVHDSLAARPSIYYASVGSDVVNQGIQFKDLLAMGSQSLIWGMDYRRVKGSSRRWTEPTNAPDYDGTVRMKPYKPDSSQESFGLYSQADFHFQDGLIDLNVGIRGDMTRLWLLQTDFEDDLSPGLRDFGSFVPSGGAQLSPWKWLKFHGTAGRSFVSPDAHQLAGSTTGVVYDSSFNPHTALFSSNPELRPESGITWDGGAGVVFGQWGFRADLTYFSTDVVDKIQQALLNPATYSYTYINLSGTTEIRGLEGEISEDFGTFFSWASHLRIFGNFTQILVAKHALSTSSKNIDILNIADQKVQAGLEYEQAHFSARLTGRYRGTVLDNFVVFQYGPVWIWDLSLGVSVTESQKVEFLMGNLMDTNYYEKAGFPMPGRNFMLREVWTF